MIMYNLIGTQQVEPLEFWKTYCTEIGEEWGFFEDMLQEADEKVKLRLEDMKNRMITQDSQNDNGVRFHKMLSRLGEV